MRLLYLHIRQWNERGIRPERPYDYNLVTGYKFHLAGSKLTVEVAQRLPEDFFSVYRPKASSSRVESVSAIIGVNGSGKTSFAAVLSRLFRKKSSQVDYVCVFEDGDDVVVYSRLDSKLQDDEAKVSLKKIGKRWIRADIDSILLPEEQVEAGNLREYERPFDVSYYSPYLSTSDLWNDERRDGYCDVSTGHYLQTRALDEKDEEDYDVPVDVVAKLGLFSTRAMLEFAHVYVNAVVRYPHHAGPELPLPRYARIRIASYELMRMIDDIPKDENDRKSRQRRMENEQFRRAHAIACSNHERDFLWRFVSELLLSYVRDLPYENVDYVDPDVELLIFLCMAVKEGRLRESGVLDFPKEFAGKGDLNFTAIKVVVEGLARRCYRSNHSEVSGGLDLMLDLVDKQDLDDAIDLAKWASRIRRRSPKRGPHSILEVTLANMSSGEMAYWTLFSRLYESLPGMYKANRRMKYCSRNLLVVLDEAETTLHPEWQRCIVRNIIWFFETMTRGLNVHVVFASHSPIILSDIPIENVAFLTKDGKEDDWRHDLKNTFAANIFDLYRQPFALVRGPIGELARNKVDKALQSVADCVRTRRPLDASSRDVLRLVGDPALQAYLQSLEKDGLLCYR